MSKPDKAVLAVVDILAVELRYANLPSTYIAELSQIVVETVRDKDNTSYQEGHPEWDACREQTPEETVGILDSWARWEERSYLDHRQEMLRRNYS